MPRQLVVPGGAQAGGGRGDAVVDVDLEEHRRRGEYGLGAVTSRSLLDMLLNLPLGHDVSWHSLQTYEQELLDAAPAGVVLRDGGVVRRQLRFPLRVTHVIVAGRPWRRSLQHAGVLQVFAPVTILGPRPPSELYAWEAAVHGYGLAVGADWSSASQLFPAEPRPIRYLKAARWRFWERAYAGGLAHLAASQPG